MNITDPIADLLTRIRNGQGAKHDVVSIPASRLKIAIAHLLKEDGFIRNFKCIRDRRQGILKIALKYDDKGNGVIKELHRMSKSSRRLFVGADDIPYVKSGFGTVIMSTSQGVMTDRDARKLHIGGEVLCSVF